MTIDKKSLEAIQLLIHEGIRSEIAPFREEILEKFNEVQSNFDTLFARDEKREQEYLIRDQQVRQIEQRLEVLERKVA